MANFFANMWNNAVDGLAQRVASYINDNMSAGYGVLGRYYTGDHRKQLKTEMGKQDDNIIQNFVGLAVDRSVSRLYKGGVDFMLPDGADAQQAYLDRLWDLNKKEILLYQIGLHGAVYGTTYYKINPNKIIDPFTGDLYPQLIAIDPEIIRVKVSPDDMNDVEEYLIQYTCKEMRDGREVEVTHKEVTHHGADPEDDVTEAPDTWVIDEYEQVGGALMTLVSSTPWPYDFPPILHHKNLPSLKSCYGDSDIDDAINVQDRSNFVVSNTGKIIKFYANPQTIGTGFSVKSMESLDTAVGVFRAIPSADAKVFNLEMNSDLASSASFATQLRQSIFDIAREIDLSTIADKLGALTNFGLQVLYTDAINKNDTKRQLYGDALLELNRRLLVLAGYTGPASDPGYIQWGEAMPLNIQEEMTSDKMALDMGIVDKQTVAERWQARYGVEWEEIQQRLQDEQSAANANNDNIGAMILRNFNRGQTPQPNQQSQERQMNNAA